MTDKKYAIQMPGNIRYLAMIWIADNAVRYSGHGLNNEPFNDYTTLDQSNTGLVSNSDPHDSLRNLMSHKMFWYFSDKGTRWTQS